MEKKIYTVWIKQEYLNNEWHATISAIGVNLSFAKGFVSGIKQYYSCPDLQIRNYHTGEIIEEIKGNGEVKPT